MKRWFRAGFEATLLAWASLAMAQPPSNFDTPNVQPNTAQPTRSLRPDNSDTKTSDAKPSAEEKPHRFEPVIWGPSNEYKFQFSGDTRLRLENHHNYDLRSKVGDNDKLGFLRTRLNFDFTYCDFMRAFVEVLDAREIDEREFQGQEDHLDIHQAFLEWKDPLKGPWGLRAGRQEMEFGRDKRLVESSNWPNLRRTYDGVRLMYRSADVDADVFLVHPEYFEHRWHDRIVTAHSHARQEEWFYGTYFTLKQFNPHTIEAYFLGLSDMEDHRTFPRDVISEEKRFGTTDRYTVGSAMYGPLWKRDGCGTLSYGAEAAYQFGHRSNDEIRAWMLHGDVNYQWDRPWKPKFTALGNLASGDNAPGDGQTNTFNPLFGGTHGPYGIIDVVRLQNLKELGAITSVEPTDKLKAQLEFHRFWLESAADSWYDGRGNSLGRDPQGKAGSRLGDEIDAIVTYKMTKFVTLEAGAAHFFPNGNFAHAVDRNDGANLLYVQTSISF
jgi:hypothetical protein